MSKKFYAVNRTTGEKWKPRKGVEEFLVMYDSGYLAVATFYMWEGYTISPLDVKEWRKVMEQTGERSKMSSHEIDTIVLGVPCTIKFDYQPYEPPERGPEAQYPGCEEEVDITDILVGGESVMGWFEDDLSEFEEAVYNERKEQYNMLLEDRAERKWSDLFG